MQIDTLLGRWRHAGGSERANCQLFIADICTPLPLPASGRGAWSKADCADALRERLIAFNTERSREEATGHIGWLRSEFQNPSVAVAPKKQAKMDLPQKPASTATARCFTGKGPSKKCLPQLIEPLVALGHARMSDDNRFGASK